MKNKIIIEKRIIEVPSKIEVNGKSYPIHQWNVDVVKKYEETKDEKILEQLKDFSLELLTT